MSSRPISVDEVVAELCKQGRYNAAVTKVLEAHGGEIMRYLVSRTSDPQLASDAFSTFSEDLLNGLPGFAFASSVRTWVFSLAHHALARTYRTLARENARSASVSESLDARQAQSTRKSTPPYLRTEVKVRMRDLRAHLNDEDRLLLDLRTAHRFSWKDIARIQLGAAAEVDSNTIEREAARLRKRFQLASERLRALAEDHGIVPRRKD